MRLFKLIGMPDYIPASIVEAIENELNYQRNIKSALKLAMGFAGDVDLSEQLHKMMDMLARELIIRNLKEDFMDSDIKASLASVAVLCTFNDHSVITQKEASELKKGRKNITYQALKRGTIISYGFYGLTIVIKNLRFKKWIGTLANDTEKK